ncbi:hypothetical protein IEO21_07099 [Rhodonia placenta]|uniref:HPP transmembrane region domain-containing protein n=1 Tax=Rhodonia placenta TaxID=104341 RepID=A0A8H7NZ05_9APHY|nr:hypothetical protein IEO21_07099 [Postia placenta]
MDSRPHRLARYPSWLTRWIGYRANTPPKRPDYIVWFWSFIGAFCGLSVLQAVFGHAHYFIERGTPSMVASFGASAVLCYGAIEAPLAQPRALVFGHFISALLGLCITKLFSLSPHFQSLRWLAASLSTSVAIVAMQITGTTHPPAGATALLPALDDDIWALSWYYLPVVLLSSMLVLATALLNNNVQRRYPVFWIAPATPPVAKPSPPLGTPISERQTLDGASSTIAPTLVLAEKEHRDGAMEGIAVVSRAAVQDLLDKMKFVNHKRHQDGELRRRVTEITDTWDFKETARPHINNALEMIESVYGHLTDLDAKVAVAIFTALGFTIDDPNVLDSLAFDQFHRRHIDSTFHGDKSPLGLFAKVANQMVEYYPSIAAGTILVSALQFVNASILENATRGTILHPKALPFVEYRRSVSGVSEAYACFIWEKASFPAANCYIQAIPNVCLFINYVNDILSFYKEELVNELSNYINDRALVTGTSATDVLRDVIGETVAAAERVRGILGEGDARDAWDAFARGYIKFHIDAPRYRLREVLGDDFFVEE